MLRALVVFWVFSTSAPAARAGDSWYEGPHGTNRIVHVTLTTVGFVVYPFAKPIERWWDADECRWCDPPGFDVAVRDAVIWDDRYAANIASDVTSYAVAPVVTIGLVALGTLEDPSWAAAIDDFTPVVESLVITQWVGRAVKIAVGRQRPHVHYNGPSGDEDNLSFFSGHTSRAFAVVASAAMVARARGYKSEPYIWALGLPVAFVSGYLRIAADRHYFSDVTAGAVIGTAIGLTVPSLMCRNSITIVPQREGVAITGTW